jgi:hypothetical protein
MLVGMEDTQQRNEPEETRTILKLSHWCGLGYLGPTVSAIGPSRWSCRNFGSLARLAKARDALKVHFCKGFKGDAANLPLRGALYDSRPILDANRSAAFHFARSGRSPTDNLSKFCRTPESIYQVGDRA